LIGAGGVTVPVQTIAGIGGLSAAYTSPVQKALNAAVTMRPPGAPALGRTLRTYGPTTGTRALMTSKAGQDQEPEQQQSDGGSVTHPHAQRLNEIENGNHTPQQKAQMRSQVFEHALRNP